MAESSDDDLDVLFSRSRHDSKPETVPSRSDRSTATRKGSKRRKLDDDKYALDTATPAHIQERRGRFDKRRERLKLKGLRLPPDYDGIYFSGDDRMDRLAQKPNFSNIRPVRPYEDVVLEQSAGTIPAPIAQWLRPYQIEGARFMHQAFVYQRGVILGDDMGLGKTIQVIAFLATAFAKTGDERDQRRMRAMRREPSQPWYPRVLLITPGAVSKNWLNELDRWGWFHIYQYNGLAKDDALDAARAGRLEIMMTTYATYRLHAPRINAIEWDCVIADECHTIKDPRSKVTTTMNEVNALCRIGLTGTPLQNDYNELWTLLNWSNPGSFGTLSLWKTNVSVPLRNGQSHTATVAELARARSVATKLVTELLPRYFLRRMKTLIAHELPKKSDRIVFCPMTPKQLQAYKNLCDSELMHQIRAGGLDKDTRALVFPALTALQKLSNHLALLVPSASNEDDKHERELDFLKEAMPDGWQTMYKDFDSLRNFVHPDYCGKWRVLKKLLKLWYENGDKVLIFSYSKRLLNMLHALLQSRTSYTVSYIDGETPYEERQRIVDDYNASPNQFVFLISTKAGGVGLNITSSNKVVVFDPNFNPSWDLQAQDRAYRIGQTRDVEVFRLVSSDTMEELVYARQIYKQQQANIALTASAERRYFKGVQSDAAQKGEIFGIANLLASPGERISLRDVIHKTNVAEAKAGVEIVGVDMEATQECSDAEEDDGSLQSSDHALSELAESIMDSKGLHKRKSNQSAKKKDPVQAILASVGVAYSHENAEVIGTSKIEQQISSRAQRSRGDLGRGQAKAFGTSTESRQDGTSPLSTSPERRYAYHPPEDVRRRQFCSMAAWNGYDDISEFAMVIEGCGQERRRKFLDDFYAARRQVLADLGNQAE